MIWLTRGSSLKIGTSRPEDTAQSLTPYHISSHGINGQAFRKRGRGVAVDDSCDGAVYLEEAGDLVECALGERQVANVSP